eukprot:COSAG04_NODE_6403_length_1334_cov_1.830769_2_plen_120_part_00
MGLLPQSRPPVAVMASVEALSFKFMSPKDITLSSTFPSTVVVIGSGGWFVVGPPAAARGSEAASPAAPARGDGDVAADSAHEFTERSDSGEVLGVEMPSHESTGPTGPVPDGESGCSPT